MSGQVHPFGELIAATANAAATETMSDQHSDWEQSWIVTHAEGAELPSQDDNRFMDRIPSQRERLQMSTFPSEIAHWTVPHAEGAEIGGSVSKPSWVPGERELSLRICSSPATVSD